MATDARVVPGRPIAEGAHAIGATSKPFTTGGLSRCYLFENGEELTLVDTGWHPDARMILEYLAHLGRSPRDITNILLTHAHRSHLGGLAMLQRLTRAELHAHAWEIPIIEGLQRAAPVSWTLRPMSLLWFRAGAALGIPKHAPASGISVLDEGDRVGGLDVLHTPGHTPGHLAFAWRDTVLAVGDAVATWPSIGAGWPGFNLDEATYRRSLRRLIAMDPEVVATGHGEPITERTAMRLSTLHGPRRW